jgi:hypothetical protein
MKHLFLVKLDISSSEEIKIKIEKNEKYIEIV